MSPERVAGEPAALLRRIDMLEAQLAEERERNLSALSRLNCRLATVEDRLGVDVQSRPPGFRAKDAAYRTGYSESGVRKLAKLGRIKSHRLGAQLIIDELPAPKKCG
jgi:hypothetical protein